MRVTVFDVNARPGLSSFSRVVTVIGNIAGAIFDEVVLRRKARACDHRAGGVEKVRAFVHRHIKIDGFEQLPIHKPLA